MIPKKKKNTIVCDKLIVYVGFEPYEEMLILLYCYFHHRKQISLMVIIIYVDSFAEGPLA